MREDMGTHGRVSRQPEKCSKNLSMLVREVWTLCAFDSLEPPGMEGGMGPMGPDGDMAPGDMGGMFDDVPPPPPQRGDASSRNGGNGLMEMGNLLLLQKVCLLLGWIAFDHAMSEPSMSIIMRLLRDPSRWSSRSSMDPHGSGPRYASRMIHLRWRNKFSDIDSSTPFGVDEFFVFIGF